MIVEGRGMGFWTWVRLPSTPLWECRNLVISGIPKKEYGDIRQTLENSGLFFQESIISFEMHFTDIDWYVR